MANYASASRAQLQAMFLHRNIRAVESKANSLGLRRPIRTARTPAEVAKAKRESMAFRRSIDREAARSYQQKNYRENRADRLAKMKEYQGRRFFWRRAVGLHGPDRAKFYELASLWKRQRGVCALTGRRLDRSAQLDHIIPKARGGSDGIGNLRWVCAQANLAKRSMTDAELLALCEDILCFANRRPAAVVAA